MLEHSFLYQEIHQQPDVLLNLIEHERAHIQRIADAIKQRRITHAFIAARGTSDNAARYAQYLFGAMNQLPVGLATPSLFSVYHCPPKFQDALVIGISQSGASPDIVSVLAEAQQQGAATLAITNEPASPLAKSADAIIPLHSGREQSVAATKTYTTQLMALALLSASIAHDVSMFNVLEKIPDQLRVVLQMNSNV